MLELKGKYNNCKVFTDNIDSETISQLTNLLNQKFTSDSQVRIMPDTHAGKGCVIGTTMTITDRIVPNLVGVDIGCGMRVVKLAEKHLDLPNLDSVIHKYVPAGFEIHKEALASSGAADILAPVNVDKAFKSLGTLGGGNHFIEVDADKNGDYWLVIHTGSRHLGIEVCDYYQSLAYENLKLKQHDGKTIQELSRELVANYTKADRKKEISKALKKLRSDYKATHVTVPFELAYLEGQAMQDYLHDMKLAQEHAKINRETIAKQILKYAKLTAAGRIISRSKAKESISMEDYKQSMNGIYTTCVSKDTIDESPMVYKSMQEIMDNIKGTVDIVSVIKPIYNFKAGKE